MEIDPAALSRRDAYRLMISCIVPRPIAFVTSLSTAGVVNLAPFSYFNVISSTPPMVMIAVGSKKEGRKDTWRNIDETREFVVNAVVPDLMDAVIVAAREVPPEVSELTLTGLTPVPSRTVKPPGLRESPIQLECALEKLVEVDSSALIIGRIRHMRVDDRVIKDGVVDASLVSFIARLGGDWYAKIGPDQIATRAK
jgi:flavin reductase (DIM6/NTAB) family NADH-FMN oxidoreductase RutF